MRQRFNNSSPGSSAHTHPNANRRNVNLKEKHKLRSNCNSRDAYDTVKTVTTSENGVETVLYRNKYNKCAYREKSKGPLMNLCLSTNLVYKCIVHTRRGRYVYTGQMADSFKKHYFNHVISFMAINKKYSTSLVDFVQRLKGDKNEVQHTLIHSKVRGIIQVNFQKMPSLLRGIPVYSVD